jgi:hypothetical protein
LLYRYSRHGALEFHPTILKGPRKSKRLEIDALTKLANNVLNNRATLGCVLNGDDDHETLQKILRVGTSAGGARAKAILAWNEKTGEFRSGQVKAGESFTYWLMKFDGISKIATRSWPIRRALALSSTASFSWPAPPVPIAPFITIGALVPVQPITTWTA